ncbi:hypothetical protein HQ325_08165 [Rhodococcus sp. BP-349]|uniref:DUF6584 family protein n=1 Tax=unclassified Rhodococcus (in: high G+C Gram-positive bacteria) TaxID=192944 RepID=UPI001C9B08A8|nr:MULTISPECIES: DUF6584 family protein [unclassified Rhodococcus (in: high G+C Gram-positive bacteria)]MBY6538642.1 hypothetical protein [Rhodococcus sp. BP-363]MBY6542979.1 hypothetical protein [Rhodococcus sp. BP-369]MBY6562209.1 hypothetical protein [Rhodococcus sp. BP-370]MBY6576501.1 hypothetical protein [Rhodococcus sp. BP-364]MBY6585802.1 hypothetical protein [Rhodococcus sp. BP-358]
MGALDRAQEDLARGEPWSARKRLTALLDQDAASQPALDLLGYACLAMDDPAGAGAAWFLTDRDDEDPLVRHALDSFVAACPTPLVLARRLPINAPSRAYPPRVRERLAVLESRVRASGEEWEPPGEVHYFAQEGVDVEAFDEWSEAPVSSRSGVKMVAAVLVIAMIGTASIATVLTVFF